MQQSAGAIIITHDKRILLQRRDDKPGLINAGKLAVFGGYLETDETAEAAVIRELQEELGVTITAAELRMISDRTYKLTGDEIRIRHFLWFEQQPRIAGIYEGSAAYFASVSDIFAGGVPVAGSVTYSLEAARPYLPDALR